MEDKDNIDQLLKIVGVTEELPQAAKATDAGVFNFILDNGIKEGNYKIPQDMIYKLYTNKTANPMQLKLFFKEFRKYFKQKRTNSVRYFTLNRKPFGLEENFSIYKLDNGYQRKQKKYKKKGDKDVNQEAQQEENKEKEN